MNPDHQVFQLDLPPLSQAIDEPVSLHVFAAVTVWLGLAAVAMGLVGGMWLVA